MNEQSNYVNVGKMTQCGHCHPEKFQAVEPCDCICHEQKQSWLDRLYEERWFEDLRPLTDKRCIEFIEQEIQKASAEADRKAREEERKKMEEEIKITLDDISMVEQDGHPFCFKKTKCEWNEALNEAKREIFKVINK